jgi:hypothetical protein
VVVDATQKRVEVLKPTEKNYHFELIILGRLPEVVARNENHCIKTVIILFLESMIFVSLILLKSTSEFYETAYQTGACNGLDIRADCLTKFDPLTRKLDALEAVVGKWERHLFY